MCQVLVEAHRIFSCSMQTFSWGMWDQFHDQRSNLGPLYWEPSLSHWTSREVPKYIFFFLLLKLCFIHKLFFVGFVLFFPFFLFCFTILSWFCHTSTCIHHGCTCVPHPETPSHLPPQPIPLGHPSAPAPSFLYPAS